MPPLHSEAASLGEKVDDAESRLGLPQRSGGERADGRSRLLTRARSRSAPVVAPPAERTIGVVGFTLVAYFLVYVARVEASAEARGSSARVAAGAGCG